MSKTLADLVREKLHAGTLPLDEPLKVWAGIGSGNFCSACEKRILRSQTEYEVQYYDGRPPVRLHVACHSQWQAERRRRVYRPFND